MSSITINNFSGGVFWFKVGMVGQDQLLNRLRALCTKLDAPVLPNGIEEAQEILRKYGIAVPFLFAKCVCFKIVHVTNFIRQPVNSR